MADPTPDAKVTQETAALIAAAFEKLINSLANQNLTDLLKYISDAFYQEEIQKAEKEKSTYLAGLAKFDEERDQARQQLEELMRDAEKNNEKKEDDELKKLIEQCRQYLQGGSPFNAKALGDMTQKLVDYARDKSPEQLAAICNKHLKIPSLAIKAMGAMFDMNKLGMLGMASSMVDLSPITNVLDNLTQQAHDNPATMAALKSASENIKDLQQMMSNMAAWNDKPTTEDQRQQNFDLLNQLEAQRDKLMANPLVGNINVVKDLNNVLQKKIDTEKKKLGVTEAKPYNPNTKTPEQIASTLNGFLKQSKIPTGMITKGIGFVDTQTLLGAAQNADALGQVADKMDQFANVCGGNDDATNALREGAATLREAQQLLKDINDPNTGFKPNPKNDSEVAHNHELLSSLNEKLESLNDNAMMNAIKAQNSDVRAISDAIQKRTEKEIQKCEKQDPSLKAGTSTIKMSAEPSPLYDSDPNTKHQYPINDKNYENICKSFAKDNGLKMQKDPKTGRIDLSDRSGAKFSVNKDMSVTFNDKSASLVAEFSNHAAPQQAVQSVKTSQSARDALAKNGLEVKAAPTKTADAAPEPAAPTPEPAKKEEEKEEKKAGGPSFSRGPAPPK